MSNGEHRDLTEGEWREAIEGRGESGLSIRAYCEKLGVSEHQFYSRQRRLRREGGTVVAKEREPRFVKLSSVPEGGWGNDRMIELEIAGVAVLRIRGGG